VPRASLPRASWSWNHEEGLLDERIRPKVMLSDSSGLRDVGNGGCSSMLQKWQRGDGQSGFCLITSALCDLQIRKATNDTDQANFFSFPFVRNSVLSSSPGTYQTHSCDD
jgi:hypothetical protein